MSATAKCSAANGEPSAYTEAKQARELLLNASPAPSAETEHAESAPSTGVAAAPLNASAAPNELHVQVEAPFIFHATGPPPAPVEDARALPPYSRQTGSTGFGRSASSLRERKETGWR